MDSKLSAAIDELVEKRTFGLDALEAIKGLRDRAVALDKKVEALNDTIRERDVQVNGLRSDRQTVQARLDAWEKREAELAARESKVRELEMSSAVAGAKALTLETVFQTIFKNVTVREQNLRAMPFTNVQNGNSHSGHHPMTETVERTAE